MTENTKKGIPRNQRLIQSLEELKLTTLKDLWNDDFRLYPQNENQHFWFEVWLNNSKADLESFNRLAKEAECEVQATYIVFPERLVLLLNGSLKKLSSRLELQNYIASFRLSKATAAFFDELTPPEQVEWVEELIDRHTYKNDSNCVICVLDTGINYAHPLLTKVMDNHDQLAENPNDTPADLNGHGTGMARKMSTSFEPLFK
ncbi:hypothetical protein RP300_01350 [Oligella urethralis]|uniref:S8 family serine peptidase n=1 Tax=Oligella urethralis TaxID=90245 RepID=UPI0029586CF2|nr:S8 family serine peptidase [Oligella urethralis]WOS37797.1 hypothetical protein RP300_01350 [Oligella urethralis]